MLLFADHDPVEIVTKKQDRSTEAEVLADKRQREAARRLWRLISSRMLWWTLATATRRGHYGRPWQMGLPPTPSHNHKFDCGDMAY